MGTLKISFLQQMVKQVINKDIQEGIYTISFFSKLELPLVNYLYVPTIKWINMKRRIASNAFLRLCDEAREFKDLFKDELQNNILPNIDLPAREETHAIFSNHLYFLKPHSYKHTDTTNMIKAVEDTYFSCLAEYDDVMVSSHRSDKFLVEQPYNSFCIIIHFITDSDWLEENLFYYLREECLRREAQIVHLIFDKKLFTFSENEIENRQQIEKIKKEKEKQKAEKRKMKVALGRTFSFR